MRTSVIQLAEKGTPTTLKVEKTEEIEDSQPINYSFEKCQSDGEEELIHSLTDELLTNSPLAALYNSAGKIDDQIKNKLQKIKIEIDEKPNISDLPQVDIQFTSEESDMVDKLYNNLAASTSALVRDELFQGLIDHWRGEISQPQLLDIIARGRSRQAQLHITVMSRLPFFSELSRR